MAGPQPRRQGHSGGQRVRLSSPLRPEGRLLTLRVDPAELDLDLTLRSGQVFRWRRMGEGEWTGLIGGCPVTLRQDGDCLLCAGDASAGEITRFLRLDISLSSICQDLTARDPALAPLFERWRGLRLLRQSPVECLLSFVCAVATSIPRIQWSLEELSSRFGCACGDGRRAFPSLHTLACAEPADLRVGAMEFRCRSLSAAARALQALGGEQYLQSLRELSYPDAAAALVRIPHVGAKVADCVLLFSLGFDCAFPLDTHTWRAAAARWPLPPHSRTVAGYRTVSAWLRQHLGQWAGWAQQYIYLDSLEDTLAKRTG